MQRDDIIQILQPHRRQLNERFGVRLLDLFGSLARDQATEGSDVDPLVEFDRPVGYFAWVRCKSTLLISSVRRSTWGRSAA
jgi:predicted nucleotidyltransferase